VVRISDINKPGGKKMKKGILVLTLFGLAVLWSLQPALAGTVEDEIRELKGRLKQLEKRLEEQNAEVKEQKEQIVEVKESKGIIDTVAERIEFHGLAEVGWKWSQFGFVGSESRDLSDIQLITIELGIEGSVFDWLSFNILPLFEEGTDDVDIFLDEASLTIGGTEKFPFYLTAGKLYLPYGRLYTRFPDDPFVNVPVTLEFGETRDSAVILGFSRYGFTLEGYVFNGELLAGKEHHFNDFGFDASYNMSNDWGSLEIGGSYISLMDAWNFQDSINSNCLCSRREGLGGLFRVTEEGEIEELEHEVGGIAAYLSLEYGNTFLTGEFMTTERAFTPVELPRWDGDGAHPQVWNIEAGYNFEDTLPRPFELVFKYAGSKDAEALGSFADNGVLAEEVTIIPKNRWGACLNIGIAPFTTYSFAYAYDRFDGAFDTALQDDPPRIRDDSHLVFSQIAVEF
jgi:hypothetical protein